MRITEAASQQILQLLTQINKGGLSVGDILTGRVIAIENGLLLLRLSDGSKISAQAVNDGQYSLGDILNLEIIEEKQGTVFVRQTDQNMISDEIQTDSKENLSLILKSLGLPVDSKHMEVLRAIREIDAEPTADIIKDALRLISDGKVSDLKQAVFLVYNNMAHRKEYFPVFRGLLNGAFNFQGEWTNIISKINTLDEKTIIQTAEGFLANEALMDIDTDDSVTQIMKLYSENTDADTVDTSIRPVIENFIKNTLLKEIIESDENITLLSTQSPQSLNTDNKTSVYGTGINDPDNMEAQSNLNSLDSTASFDDKMTFDTLMKQILPKYIIKEDKSRQDEISGIIKNLLLQVKEKLPGTGLTIDRAKKIISSSASKLLDKASVESSEAKLPKIDEWARDTERKLYLIKNALYKSPDPEKERVQASLRELDTALKFFQDIISYEAYAQIPLELKEYPVQGEIYIMKRKNKRGKLNPDDFSVFLSLTTLNLGTLDTFINVRNKSVMLRFMTEDEKYFGLLQEEYKSLFEALKEKGYNLYEIKCSLREEGINLINANKKASELVSPQNKKIDMRI